MEDDESTITTKRKIQENIRHAVMDKAESEALKFKTITEMAKHRWLKTPEIEYLLDPDTSLLPILNKPQIPHPQSGSLFLYDREAMFRHKKDEYNWIKKRNSRKVREDRVKLYIDRKYAVVGIYRHSTNPITLHRRSFHFHAIETSSTTTSVVQCGKTKSRNTRPSLALVHYLDTEIANELCYREIQIEHEENASNEQSRSNMSVYQKINKVPNVEENITDNTNTEVANMNPSKTNPISKFSQKDSYSLPKNSIYSTPQLLDCRSMITQSNIARSTQSITKTTQQNICACSKKMKQPNKNLKEEVDDSFTDSHWVNNSTKKLANVHFPQVNRNKDIDSIQSTTSQPQYQLDNPITSQIDRPNYFHQMMKGINDSAQSNISNTHTIHAIRNNSPTSINTFDSLRDGFQEKHEYTEQEANLNPFASYQEVEINTNTNIDKYAIRNMNDDSFIEDIDKIFD